MAKLFYSVGARIRIIHPNIDLLACAIFLGKLNVFLSSINIKQKSEILANDGLRGNPDVVLASEAQDTGLSQDQLGLLLRAVQQEDPALCPLHLDQGYV
jgi:hypothetical protein